MHLVAIARLATSIEDEARALAEDLGTLAYEERRKLSAGLPAIVLATRAPDRARSLVEALRARGHGVVECEAAKVVPSSEMISLHRFRLDDDALVASHLPDTRLPWRDISALILATHHSRTERKVVTARTGVLTRTRLKRVVATHTPDAALLLYVFRRSGQRPWLLRRQGTSFEGLGPQRAHVGLRNFMLTVEQLQTRAPAACYDDRLASRGSTAHSVDMLAHVLATWIAATDSPYR